MKIGVYEDQDLTPIEGPASLAGVLTELYTHGISRIVLEPGDGTRYEIIIAYSGNDRWAGYDAETLFYFPLNLRYDTADGLPACGFHEAGPFNFPGFANLHTRLVYTALHNELISISKEIEMNLRPAASGKVS